MYVGRELTHDLVGTLTGPGALWRGFRMWKLRPRLMLLGAVPALIVLIVLTAGLVALVHWSSDLVHWATPFLGDDSGPADVVRLFGQVAVIGAYLFAAWTMFVALTLAIGDPFYAKIWRETERMLGGPVPTGEVSAWRATLDAGRLLTRSAVLAVGVAVIGLVPVVGTVIAAVLGFMVAGSLLAGELVARPLEGRGIAAAERAALIKRKRGRVLGFGLATQACFWVPFVAVVAMPAAVVGATMLAREILDEPLHLPG